MLLQKGVEARQRRVQRQKRKEFPGMASSSKQVLFDEITNELDCLKTEKKSDFLSYSAKMGTVKYYHC